MKKLRLILILYLFSGLIFAINDSYVKSLIEEEDYYRAISELKENLFYADENYKNNYLIKLSAVSLLSKKPEITDYYLKQLEIKLSNTDSLYSRYLFHSVLFDIENRHFIFASEKIQSIKTQEFIGLKKLLNFKISVELEETNPSDINALVDSLPIIAENEKIEITSLLKQPVQVKSRTKSMLFSALIPGSGQIYCKHYYDGLQSFFYIGTLTLCSVISLKYDSDHKDQFPLSSIIIPVNSLFYLANIYGARQTADFINKSKMIHRQKRINSIIDKYTKKAIIDFF